MKTARKKVSAGTLFERFGIVLILILDLFGFIHFIAVLSEH